MLMVQNQKAALNEFNVAAALTQLGLTYVFHPVVDELNSDSEESSVDFLVGTTPKATPLKIHKIEDGEDDSSTLKEDSTVLKDKDWYPMVAVQSTESMTVEDALIVMRRELMV